MVRDPCSSGLSGAVRDCPEPLPTLGAETLFYRYVTYFVWAVEFRYLT